MLNSNPIVVFQYFSGPTNGLPNTKLGNGIVLTNTHGFFTEIKGHCQTHKKIIE
jgi:hypothetical protein